MAVVSWLESYLGEWIYLFFFNFVVLLGSKLLSLCSASTIVFQITKDVDLKNQLETNATLWVSRMVMQSMMAKGTAAWEELLANQ
jgi:hypothetical protein